MESLSKNKLSLKPEHSVYKKLDIVTHVFNFRKTFVNVLGIDIKPFIKKGVLPIFIRDKITAKSGLSMLLSSGDWFVNGVSNVQKHKDYDIHVCYPEPGTDDDTKNPLAENVKDAIHMNKIICFVDYLDDESVNLLAETFNNVITHLDTIESRISPTYNIILKLLHTNAHISKKVLLGIKWRITYDKRVKAKYNKAQSGIDVNEVNNTSHVLTGGLKTIKTRRKHNSLLV